MYDRNYAGKTLAFEPSGGLMNAALIMRDRETDSWWSIITGDAIGGQLDGTPLVEVPGSQKMKFKDWKKLHPNTLVLSVDGKEHDPSDPYLRYFESSQGFRGLSSDDKRLYDKASIYAFHLDDVPYAVPHTSAEGGVRFDVTDNREIFLWREIGAEIFASTFAYIGDKDGDVIRFVKRDGEWIDTTTGNTFSSDDGFDMAEDMQSLGGFDTFWYTWTTTLDDVQLLQ